MRHPAAGPRSGPSEYCLPLQRYGRERKRASSRRYIIPGFVGTLIVSLVYGEFVNGTPAGQPGYGAYPGYAVFIGMLVCVVPLMAIPIYALMPRAIDEYQATKQGWVRTNAKAGLEYQDDVKNPIQNKDL